jgi:DNA-binding beta-propeller fold protein YncE
MKTTKILFLSLILVLGSAVVPSIAQASFTLSDTYTVNAGPNVVRVTPDGAHIYVINATGRNVSRITVATALVETITVGVTPTKLAISPDGLYVYVTNNGDGTVTRIKNSDLSKTLITGVCAAPTNIAITPDGTKAYVGCGASLGVIDLITNTALSPISVPLGSWFLAIDNAGTYVYTGGYDAKITQVKISDGTIVKNFTMYLFGIDMTIAPDGTYLYMLNANGAVVKSAIPSLSSYTHQILGGYLNNNMVVDPSGLYGYVGTGSGVRKFNLTTLTSVGTVVSESSVDVAISSDGSSLFTVNSSTNQVKRFISADVAGAPTIGTATALSPTSASISFTAPVSNGGATIETFTATSTPGSFIGKVAQSGSGSITVTGLAPSTAYTFTVTATNGAGTSSPSSASISITMPSSEEELAAQKATELAAKLAQQRAADLLREKKKQAARDVMFKNFQEEHANPLDVFIDGEINGASNKNYSSINTEILSKPLIQRLEISEVLKVSSKYAIMDQISLGGKFAQIYAPELTESGLVEKSHQSAITYVLRMMPGVERDTYEEIQAVIAAEVKKASERKARLSLVIAALATR